MICSICCIEESVCIISVFIPGREEDNIHNTYTAANTCMECTDKIIRGDILLTIPENAYTLQEALEKGI